MAIIPWVRDKTGYATGFLVYPTRNVKPVTHHFCARGQRGRQLHAEQQKKLQAKLEALGDRPTSSEEQKKSSQQASETTHKTCEQIKEDAKQAAHEAVLKATKPYKPPLRKAALAKARRSQKARHPLASQK